MQQITRYANGKRYTCKPASNGVWYIYWSENRRSKRQSTGQKDEASADAFLDEWLKLETAPASVLTCRDIWTMKYPDSDDKASPVHYPGKALMAFFGDKRPCDVSQAMENEYVRKRGVAASTIRLELSLLRSSWNNAVRRRVLSADDIPALDPLPKPSPPRERWLRDDEVENLIKTAEDYIPRIWAFLHVALETGARRTAISELKWSQVDWETGVIHFLPEGAQQSRKRRASVPISKRLRPILEQLYEDRRDDFVIGAGGPVNDGLKRVAKKAGVRGVSPHVLRHTAATRMARRGVPLWLIAKVLGNTIEQVESVYAKHTPDMLVDAVNAISGKAA